MTNPFDGFPDLADAVYHADRIRKDKEFERSASIIEGLKEQLTAAMVARAAMRPEEAPTLPVSVVWH